MHYTPPSVRAFLSQEEATARSRRDPGPWPMYFLTALVGLLTLPDTVFQLTRVSYFQDWSLSFGTSLSLSFTLIAAFLGGLRVVYVSLENLFEGKFSADITVAIACVAAIVLGETWVASVVVFIALLGECIERSIYMRATNEIGKILELAPHIAHVIRDGVEVNVPIDELQLGETVVVRPGERIPVDGLILQGESDVDQSALTGESLPTDKTVHDEAYAGTLNGYGALEIRADRLGSETTLGQVIRVLANATQRKSPIERTADFYAKWFLPTVLVLAAITFFYTNWGVTTLNWKSTLSVLVVACPCALILATPAAALAATAWLANRGVIIKGSVALERLATIDSLVFDKTGTLTQGKLTLERILPIHQEGSHEASSEVSENQLLQWAATAETRSEHVIAELLITTAGERDLELPPIINFQSHAAAGVTAEVEVAEVEVSGESPFENFPKQIAVGNLRLMRTLEIEISEEVESQLKEFDALGCTSLIVATDGQIRGLIAARDTLRTETAAVLQELKTLGIQRFALLTGDRLAPAETVANQLGIFDEVVAEQLPHEKAEWIANWKSQHHRVGMVGDGINDAPALAISDVGIALGGVGSDLAAEAGDLVLMGDPLRPLPSLIRLSRQTLAIIKQNILLFAFGLNLIAILLANVTWNGEPLLSPVAAAIFHLTDSVLVMLNSARLLWFERWNEFWLGRWIQSINRRLDQVGEALSWDSVMRFWERRGVRVLQVCGALLFLHWAISNLHWIAAEEQAIVTRYGKYRDQLEPGLHWRLPTPLERVYRAHPDEVQTVRIGLSTVDVSTEGEVPTTTPDRSIAWETMHAMQADQPDSQASLVLTGDEVLATISATISYRLSKDGVRAYLLNSKDPASIIQSSAEHVLRTGALRYSLDQLLTTSRLQLQQETQTELAELLSKYELGIEIVDVSINDLHPPIDVVPAYRDVASAMEERQQKINQAQTYFHQEVLQAGGEQLANKLQRNQFQVNQVETNPIHDFHTWTDEEWKSALTTIAGGEAAKLLEQAHQECDQRTYTASGESARFEKQLAAYQTHPWLGQTRLFWESMERVLSNRRKVILDPSVVGKRRVMMADPEKMMPRNLIPFLPPKEDEEVIPLQEELNQTPLQQ